jgi:diaminohydroxyphosphoribosylaminopyrimidine deaminase/5-amino-6-(5-phosphoribosylamino)uracil reductase
MSDHDTDAQFLRHALALARKGIGLTSPNPCVGGVVVGNEVEIAGEGFHTYDGMRHAEIIALEQAGEKARGATLYVNLEPCSHVGRTGPCAEAIIKAKISRVVACMQDPNPRVSGAGFERLRAAGVTVEVGALENEARLLNERFAKYIRHRTPLVTLKAAMTLDGKIAPPPRKTASSGGAHTTSVWITSEEARAHVQQLRHQNDAIMVGVGTVLADDPLLTDRSGLARRRPLLRVILDSRLRLPLDARVVQTAQDDVIVLCSLAEEKTKKKLQKLGVRVEQIPVGTTDGRPDMAGIVSFLGEIEITGVLIEGGSHVNWAALASGVVDKVFLYYAPHILAGGESIPFADGPGFRGLRDSPRVKSFSLHRIGEDFALEGYLRDPYVD